jgi:EAL domain-containing protein (putative c-di-GMP-specific phosphodiesterase class I)
MDLSGDLMLILDSDPESSAVLCTVAERLGCEHIETDSVEFLQEILATRQPTLAVLAVDRVNTNCLAAIDALANHNARPATLIVGSVGAKVLARVKAAAESRGLPVFGVASRPFDATDIEKLLAPHLSVARPIPREEIESALTDLQLTLMYQPKMAIASGTPKILGVEALVRWQHPLRGLLQPRHFLGAVEDYGLMSQLTDFVMTEAVRQASQWRARGVPLEMTINLSTRLVQDREFPERLAMLLQENDTPADQLILDVTESLNVQDQSLVLDVFTRLRILGVGLSLDNFGTGMSSLTELYRMPYSEIKVDHSLIADVPRKREARVIVEAIANLAHMLRMTVCAEGVESRQVLEFVRRAGFDTAQGRFFSEPVAAESLERIVKAWPTADSGATGSWRTALALDFEGGTTTNRILNSRAAEGKAAT